MELEDVSEERNSDDSKVCGKRIRIGAKLGIKGIVNAFVNLCIERTKRGDSVQDALTDNGGDGAQIGSSGDGARIASSGHGANIETRSTNCVMMCAGQSCLAKGKIGSWIVLTEWIDGVPNVVARRIDGASIKADVWYTLRDGQLQESNTNE